MPASGANNKAARKKIATNRRRQSGAAAGGDAGRALDIARRRRGADQRAEHGGKAVGDQRLFHPRQIAVGVGQSGAMGDADQGAGIVEHVDEQKTEDDDEERRFGDPREIELQERGRERRRRRHDAGEFRQSQRNADRGDDEDADQRAADDAAIVQRRDQHQAEQAQDRLGLVQIAERDQRRRTADDDLGLLRAR